MQLVRGFEVACFDLCYISVSDKARAETCCVKVIQPAESARAVTGRRCPHSGNGKDFLTGQPDFSTETAVTPERQVEKSFLRSEINRYTGG